jgi:hypothetical protein
MNRRTRARAYRAEARMKSERSRFEKAGIEPGEAYRGLWLHLLDVKDHIDHARTDEDKKYWKREYS